VENQTDVSGDQETVRHGPRIFLNYRRKDTEDTAGRLFDALSAHFGEDRVFMDIDDIDPGVDFDQVVHEAVGKCDVLLAMIGPNWLTATDKQGRRRLENSDDYVRVELQVALQRDIRVVPILVHGVEMPREDELPDGLQRLARKQALGLSNEAWKYDFGRLIAALESAAPRRVYPSDVHEPKLPGQPAARAASTEAAQAAPPSPPPRQKPVRRKRRRWLWAAGAIVVLLAILAAAGGGSSSSHSTTTLSNAASHAASIGITVTTSCTGASSGNETQAATISWLNSTKSTAKIYWLTYSGARDLYDTLAPGQSYSQQTYVGHRWLVVESGACSAMTVMKPGAQMFTIH
jgi:TIR domain/VHL beta domain